MVHKILTSRCLDTLDRIYLVDLHHSKALWNILIHGETVVIFDATFCEINGHCQGKTALSGCGIMAKCRPSSEQIPATPSIK